MKQNEKMSAEELLGQMELKAPITWETFQYLIVEYPELEEDLLVLTQNPT